MRYVMLLGSMVLMTSCTLLPSREDLTSKLVNDTLMAINWNDVDQFPVFGDCEETLPKMALRNCFEESMVTYLSNMLDGLTWEVEQPLNDSAYVDFLVDEDGFITMTEVSSSENIIAHIPNFNSTLRERLKNLNSAAPALKRNIPVKLKFRLPIILNTIG